MPLQRLELYAGKLARTVLRGLGAGNRAWLPVGLLRQYMPKGSDLSIYSQKELDAIALSLNTRPRARLGFESPLVVYTQHIALLQSSTDTVH